MLSLFLFRMILTLFIGSGIYTAIAHSMVHSKDSLECLIGGVHHGEVRRKAGLWVTGQAGGECRLRDRHEQLTSMLFLRFLILKLGVIRVSTS